MKKKNKYILIIATILLILIRLSLFPFQSGDYKMYLSKWVNTMSNHGGIFSLKKSFTDYNYPYLIFLSILSYIPIKPLYFIKIFSVVFDLLIAIIGYKFVYKYSSNKERNSLLAYIFLLASPVIILNSSMWAQCDSIYTFFILLSIYYLCEEKITRSFIFLGISFSLKLQTIFIFPFFIILYFCFKKIKLYHFLIIPLVNFIMCIPAYLIGGSLLHTFTVYIIQTGESSLGRTITNIYNFLPNHQSLIIIGVLLTLFIFLYLLKYYYDRRDNLNSYNIINLALLSCFICYFFLPCMHERYSYLIDVLSIIWFFIYRKKIYIPILTNICSLTLYISYLFNINYPIIIPQLLTIVFSISFIGFFKTTIYELNNKN